MDSGLIWGGFGEDLGGSWAQFGKGLGRSGPSCAHLWAHFGGFLDVQNHILLKHSSKMGFKRPFGWIFRHFGKVLDGFSGALGGFGSVWGVFG